MKRATVLTIAAVATIGLVVYGLTTRDWLVRSSWWQKTEGLLIDRKYLLRGELPADTNIVIVGIESTSLKLDALRPEDIAVSPTLQQLRASLPLDRRVYAATLEKLMGAGAKVVVFDFLFTLDRPEDEEFAKVLAKYRDRVVIASEFNQNERRFIPPNEKLWPATNETGLINVWADSDRVVRRGRYRTSLEREDEVLGRFARPETDDLIHATALAARKFRGRVETPPYDRDNFINYSGGWKYKSVAIEHLFVKSDWDTPPINGGILFRNKIVIVGPLAETYKDVHRTPFGEIAGPELQAQMMATLLNGSSLAEPSERYQQVLLIVMILLAAAICLLASNAVMKTVLMAGTLAGFFTVCQFAFSRGNLVIGMMAPVFGFATTGLIGLVLQFFLEQRERQRYRNVLNRYVSKRVADLVLADLRSYEESLNGQKKSVTILFSDIRGFTSMSEGRDAEQLVKQLNEYFKEMVEVVQDVEDGTLQKFIGDAIMAGWGDTHSLGFEEDARRAVRAALQMRERLRTLNARWAAKKDRLQLEIGVGVNHGEAIVGNIGNPARTEFTVLGDAVNLAARLETATKQYHVDILVGEKAEALTRAHFIFRKVGLLTVKGRAHAVEAFTVLGERSQPEPAWLGRYHEGVALFRAREFGKASGLFKAVAAELGAPDFLCAMYLEWCARYEKEPPPADWAGNFVLTEK